MNGWSTRPKRLELMWLFHCQKKWPTHFSCDQLIANWRAFNAHDKCGFQTRLITCFLVAYLFMTIETSLCLARFLPAIDSFSIEKNGLPNSFQFFFFKLGAESNCLYLVKMRYSYRKVKRLVSQLLVMLQPVCWAVIWFKTWHDFNDLISYTFIEKKKKKTHTNKPKDKPFYVVESMVHAFN